MKNSIIFNNKLILSFFSIVSFQILHTRIPTKNWHFFILNTILLDLFIYSCYIFGIIKILNLNTLNIIIISKNNMKQSMFFIKVFVLYALFLFVFKLIDKHYGQTKVMLFYNKTISQKIIQNDPLPLPPMPLPNIAR